MRILVIGGTGFVGCWVVRYLVAQGHEITVFHRGRTEADLPATIHHLYGDRHSLADFREDFRHLAPGVVVDIIPMTEQDARSLVETFKGIAGRIVAISSGDVYRAYGVMTGLEHGPLESVPVAEDAPLRQRLYPYRGKIKGMDDYEKILVERAVMANPDLPGTVLRLAMVYGSGDRKHRLLPELKRMDDGRPAIILETSLAAHRGSRVYVENAAAAIALVATDERAAGRIYNVAEADALTEAEWVRLIGQVAGWHGEILILDRGQLPEALRAGFNTAQHLVADTTRIRSELGYTEPISREETVRRTIAWERANPPADIDPSMFDYAAEDNVLARNER